MFKEPDYSTYSKDELLQVSRDIDKDAFPERYQRVLLELEKPRPTPEKKKVLSAKNAHLLGCVSSTSLVVLFLYLEKIPGRGGHHTTMEDSPIFYWFIVAAFAIGAIIELREYWRARKHI
ncbi:MAG: hypothetical protein LAT66_09980 [Alkalimonas sp.]|nr:hypothetical protein [Alkalimonas sp.]